MEAWKIIKFCETSSIEELRKLETALQKRLDAGELSTTNARFGLQIVREHIEYKELLER